MYQLAVVWVMYLSFVVKITVISLVTFHFAHVLYDQLSFFKRVFSSDKASFKTSFYVCTNYITLIYIFL